MSNIAKKFENLLGTDLFQALQSADVVDVAQLNAITALLIKLNLPFSLNFNQSTSEEVASAQLIITLTPTITLTLLLPFARGPTVNPSTV
ncbi:MAG TPA: hypothetical protein VNT57_02450 [Desulfobacteria bacterium]|nr:hypothetical protein [Desulfobacteria bacterium]